MVTLDDMQILQTNLTKPTKHFLGGKTKQRKAPRRNRTKCGYDDRGRLVDIDTGAATYVHNGQGQRVKKDNGTVTLFAYDEIGGLVGEYDSGGTAILETVWFNGAPVAALQGTNRYYVHTDQLGSPRVITDGNTIIWRWQSDPFGFTAPDEDVDGNGTPLTYNLRFPGQYFDVETGLHYNYHRTYDPTTGRYLESDPIGLGGGLNTYGYVSGNPLSYVDPLGLLEIIGDATSDQRAAIELAEEIFRQGLGDICEEERSKLQDILDNGTATVDPYIDDPLRRSRDPAIADYEKQNIQFNYWFFLVSQGGRSSTFAHETRHLMRVNYDLLSPSDRTKILVGPLNPNEYHGLPAERDADLFSDIYNKDACFCELK